MSKEEGDGGRYILSEVSIRNLFLPGIQAKMKYYIKHWYMLRFRQGFRLILIGYLIGFTSTKSGGIQAHIHITMAVHLNIIALCPAHVHITMAIHT